MVEFGKDFWRSSDPIPFLKFLRLLTKYLGFLDFYGSGKNHAYVSHILCSQVKIIALNTFVSM